MEDYKITTQSLYLALLSSLILIQGCEKPNEISLKTTYKNNITINECWFEVKSNWPLAECGVLNVPENYSKPDSRTIELPFIIFKAYEPKHNTYPLIITGAGGPGGRLGISEIDKDIFSPSIWLPWNYSTLESGRDLILIDNRGVGSAKPRLSCPEVELSEISILHKRLEISDIASNVKSSYSACKDRLTKNGVDVSQYHVINAAKDLEELRVGLNIEKFNVYGVSYGTRISLMFEKLYPKSVRSLVLDGVYPLTSNVYENNPRRDSLAIKRIISKCKKHKLCSERFGNNLEERLSNLLAKLDKEPISIKITSPIDYKPLEVLVTADVLFDSLFSATYSDASIAYLPKYLNSMFEGNTDYLTELVRDYYVYDLTADSLDVGAYASYSCFDQIPFTDFAVARSQINKYPFQHYSNHLILEYAQAMCEAWDVPVADTNIMDPYEIQAPVLLYSGELDPVTPEEMTVPVISNARLWYEKVWSNLSHGVMFYSECTDWTAEVFLNNPESNPFIYECSDDKSEFNFVLK